MSDISKTEQEIAFQDLLDNGPEILVYYTINSIGGFIWQMNHSMADGRIPECDHAAIDKDIANVRKQQVELIKTLPKYGVSQPLGENDQPTPEYWLWFRWWDSYAKSLSNEEFYILNNLLSDKGDVSKFRPEGNWKK